MIAGLDWSKLYSQGRCKEIGVPWNDTEAHAVHTLKIPAALVREGVLTLEEYEKRKGEKQETKEELFQKAKALGSQATKDAPEGVLKKEIEQLSGKNLDYGKMTDEEIDALIKERGVKVHQFTGRAKKIEALKASK